MSNLSGKEKDCPKCKKPMKNIFFAGNVLDGHSCSACKTFHPLEDDLDREFKIHLSSST